DLGGGADGMVVQTLNLDPGSYSIFVGGGRYYDLLNTGGDSSSFGFLLTASTIPEPSTGSLAGIAFVAWMLKRRRG
ncbi:MAG: PEP-CTERM sorting domain-containing protein, partial [Verrucomicrobia bacterium]|nr:PEP-CTERM sorting domain-containing protein [Verrucomicrobiota bacterium]